MTKHKILFSLLFLGSFFVTNAQVDVTLNPVNLFRVRGDLSAEFGATKDVGVEAIAQYLTPSGIILDAIGYEKGVGGGVAVLGKYYFKPSEDGLDRFNIGLYTNYKAINYTAKEDSNLPDGERRAFSGGIYFGYKSVSKRNIVFDIGFGLGRYFKNDYQDINGEGLDISSIPYINFDWFGKLGVGYRFNTGTGNRR